MTETQLIRYDPTAALASKCGVTRQQLAQLAPRLEDARREVLADVDLFNSGGSVPKAKQPLDAGFIELPDRLLDEYREVGSDSELGTILKTANRIAKSVDRFVVAGIGGSYMGARALFEALSKPYHNELPRDRRKGPRIYFEGNNVDSDALGGLIELLNCNVEGSNVEGSNVEGSNVEGSNVEGSNVDSSIVESNVAGNWAIVVISKSGKTLETAVAFRVLLGELEKKCAGDKARLAELVVPVTGLEGRLRDVAEDLGCDPIFRVPDGVGGRYSILSAVGLLPAAILGIDIVSLLEGAAAMTRHFRAATVGENPVMDYVGISHLLEQPKTDRTQGGEANIRVLSMWGKSLEAAGLWYDQLLSESLGKDGRGATPITAVNTRDLHSRHQQHQEGRRDKLFTNVIIDELSQQSRSVGHRESDHDKLNQYSDKTLFELMAAARAGTDRALADDARPTTDLHLPRRDAASIGQLFQMLMLATAVEGRLIGINPYGQPGVEGYKKHMNQVLQES